MAEPDTEAVTEAANALTVSDEVNGARNHPDAATNQVTAKDSEERKVFVGGISADTNNEDLLSFFSQFGPVNAAQVKYDRVTARSRGFAFVEFQDAESCRKALAQREQTLKNKAIEVKPAKSRENKKVFVGGLPADFPEEELRAHFEKHGKVEDIEWPFDRQRNVKRNFAFVVFETEEGADEASQECKQMFGERECDVKKATPQSRRNQFPMAYAAPTYGGYAYPPYGRQGYAGRGRAQPMGGFGAYGTYQGAGWAGGSSGSWNDQWNWGAQSGAQYGGYYAGAPGQGNDYWANSQPSQAAPTTGNSWGGAQQQGAFDSYSAGGGRGRAQPYAQGYTQH